jgi:hypothetical protein
MRQAISKRAIDSLDYIRNVAERRPIVHVALFSQENIASEVELAARVGGPKWPRVWPDGHNLPELLCMFRPLDESYDETRHARPDYQLRSITDGLLLVVTGHRRSSGNLEGGLLLLEGERFETWSRPGKQNPHIVVRAPVWDVHVSGAVTFDTALSVARELIEVPTSA